MSVPNLRDQVTLIANERVLRDAFRRCRRSARTPQHDPQAENLVKRIDSGRVLLARHMIQYAWNSFTRLADRADVEAPGWAYITTVSEWYAQRDGRKSLRVLMEEETRLQGLADLAQMRLAADPHSPSAIVEAEQAITAHHHALEELRDELRRLAYSAADEPRRAS